MFLFLMFVVCAIAVTLFARNQVEASLLTETVSSPAATSSTTVAPTRTSTELSATTDAVKSDDKLATDPVEKNESVTAATELTEIMLSGSSVGTSSSDTVKEPVQTKTTETATTIETKPVKTTAVTESKTSATAAQEPTRTATGTPTTATKMIEVTVEPVNNPAVRTAAEANIIKSIVRSESKEEELSQPVTIKAVDLKEEKNPKISGVISAEFSIQHVEMIKKYDGQKTLLLTGKALPNSMLAVYIFSEDPVVVTVKTDESGNWSYELSKELEDGQHEVYVAITEDDGRIVSKAEPLAFVKTAEAATVVPFSQLDSNKSPMQKSTPNYILMAIALMSVCLVVALALIGILTHKYNNDEQVI